MAARTSAGLLLFRRASGVGIEVLLVHPGGPYWARRDEGAWSIPKGEGEQGEDLRLAARREFREELGQEPPPGELIDLGELAQSSVKRVHVWAIEGVLDAGEVSSNTFEMEWPPHSQQMRCFPEVDRAGWFDCETAKRKLIAGQRPFIDLLEQRIRETAH